MYDSKQLYRKEKAENVKSSAAGNRTGIPGAIKAQYEAASGLSFDDVRIHYNSRKPEKLQALAYTQGNHVYMGPGQEKYLRHELGHVVQQKRGMVRPNMRINGLPVNTDRRLEQQADRGVVSAGQTVPAESRQDIVQGVFMKWVSEGSETYLAESGNERGSVNSENMSLEEILSLLKSVRSADLSGKLKREIYGRLCAMTEDEEKMRVLRTVFFLTESEELTMDMLDHDCCNELWLFAKRLESRIRRKPGKYHPDDKAAASGVQGLAEKEMSKACKEEDQDEPEEVQEEEAPGAEGFDSKRYPDLIEEIESLEQLIDSAAGEEDPVKKEQLKQLIKYSIHGHIKLKKRYRKDVIMWKIPLNKLQRRFHRVFGERVGRPEGEAYPIGAQAENMLPATYAAEKSQQVPLPARETFSAALTDREPIVRSGADVTADLSRAVLEKVQQSDSRERLVIYRSMGAQEAVSILRFFNSSQVKEAERAVRDGVVIAGGNAARYVAALGKHYGEYAQAAQYDGISHGDHANVLLAFVLKPGAKELLFSKSMLVLPQAQNENPQSFWCQLREAHSGYGRVSASEGAMSGYIGIKPESVGESLTYSLGIARGSRLLLQLLIDRVEVKRIYS